MYNYFMFRLFAKNREVFPLITIVSSGLIGAFGFGAYFAATSPNVYFSKHRRQQIIKEN